MPRKFISDEDRIQIAVIEWLSLQQNELLKYIHSIPNESKRTAAYCTKLKRMGMKPGASDLFIAIPKKKFHGAYIEIKANEKSRVADSQIQFQSDMTEMGYFCAITRGIDETIDTIKDYLEI